VPSRTRTSRSPARWSAWGQGGEGGYSGFTVRDPVTGEETATPLDELLRRRGVGRVVVVGLATDYCVKETALDALR
jgi:nicotinamidase/pyrazinamidase